MNDPTAHLLVGAHSSMHTACFYVHLAFNISTHIPRLQWAWVGGLLTLCYQQSTWHGPFVIYVYSCYMSQSFLLSMLWFMFPLSTQPLLWSKVCLSFSLFCSHEKVGFCVWSPQKPSCFSTATRLQIYIFTRAWEGQWGRGICGLKYHWNTRYNHCLFFSIRHCTLP